MAFMATTNFSPIRSVKILSFSRASTDSESDCGNLWNFEPRLNGFVSVYHMIRVVIRSTTQNILEYFAYAKKTSCESKEEMQPHKHVKGIKKKGVMARLKMFLFKKKYCAT